MAAVVEPVAVAPTDEDRLFPSDKQLAQQLSFIAGSRYCADRPMIVLVSAGAVPACNGAHPACRWPLNHSKRSTP